ncbi:MAG: hypothetical protein R3F19_32655 [Verrucomicrobiales bacterium]
MKRRIKIILGIVLVAWVLTLGSFHERTLRSDFTVGGAGAWERFDKGDSRVYPNTWVNSGSHSQRGIPFILSSTVDRPPYSLSFCFTIAETDPARALILEGIDIQYADGSQEIVEIPDGGVREEFDLDERGKDRGETVYSRVNFSFPEAINKREDCIATLRGHFETPSGSEPYTEDIEISLVDESYVYIGWVTLLLRQF